MESTSPITTNILHKDDLPTAIIIIAPKELFDDEELKKNFGDLFVQVDPNVRIDYLKGFNRVRVVYNNPESATAAKLLVEHHQFRGMQFKAFFAQVCL
jgi:hypothetical protein